MDIDVEQCRENDKIKEIISSSHLPIKYIKLLLRISDSIYLNAINYNFIIKDKKVIIKLISSKPQNENGKFNTASLTNVLYKLRELEKENNEVQTECDVKEGMVNLIIRIRI